MCIASRNKYKSVLLYLVKPKWILHIATRSGELECVGDVERFFVHVQFEDGGRLLVVSFQLEFENRLHRHRCRIRVVEECTCGWGKTCHFHKNSL